MAREDIRQFTLEEIKALNEARQYTKTRSDASELELDDDFWDHAHIIFPAVEGKDAIKLRIDRDVLSFFKAGGRGYQTRMNAVLRAYVESQKRRLKKNQQQQPADN